LKGIALKAVTYFIFGVLMGIPVLPSHIDAVEIEPAVVRIINHFQRSQWDAPWESYSVGKMTGSGFVIQDGLIMTNAHVVSDSRMLLIYLNGDPTPHEAEVTFIGHDCDLAVLEPLDKTLLSKIPGVALGGLPELRSTVETYGYPTGGQRISSTKGVVSRIEINRYVHSMLDYHLTVQTDAAINPGNSGGPVVQNGKVVGVAFQGSSRLENAGWFIPMEVVNHFLVDIEDGVYDGYPDLAVMLRNLENPAYRRKTGMLPGQTGEVVEAVYPGGSADGYLLEGDVIREIEGYPIANDGTVDINGLRLDASVLLDRKQKGERVQLHVWRQGKPLDLKLPMKGYSPLVRMGNIYDRMPSYFIYAGLVFVPLNVEVLKLFGRNWNNEAPASFRHAYRYKAIENPEHIHDEPVVMLRRLDHPVNINMAYSRNLMLERVNGRRITRLEDLVDAIESNQGEYQTLEFGGGIVHVLRTENAGAANDEILRRYGIQKDRRL
jgi:S1-C subfamily serine protease